MIACIVSGRGLFLGFATARVLPLLLLSAAACARLSGASDLEVTTGGAAGTTASGGTGATGGGTGGTAGVGGGGSAGASGQLDYAKGSWQVENVSNSAGSYSREPTLILAGSELFVAWTEPDAASDVQIWAGAIGKPAAQVTTNVGSSASLAYGDGHVLLSWTSSEDGDYDVYLAMGPDFAQGINLTPDPATMQTDVDGALAAGGGTYALAHRSWVGESVVVVRTWTDPFSTEPTQVISGKGSCEHLNLIADGAGKLHLMTICPSGIDGGNVFYTNNVLGSWLPPADIGAGTTGNRNGALAMGPNDSWFAAWKSGLNDLIYTTKSAGGEWSAPKVALPNIIQAALAIDAQGRLLIAFDRPDGNVYFTWFENGIFTTPVFVGPGEGPRTLVLDAGGLPHFVFQKEGVSGQATSTDIWLAKFTPGN